jgi:hypothetical protein
VLVGDQFGAFAIQMARKIADALTRRLRLMAV